LRGGEKDNAEDANNDIEGGVRISERQHVLTEFDIAEALGARFIASPSRTRRSAKSTATTFSCGPTAPAAGKADPPLPQQTSSGLTFTQAEALDGLPSEPMPEGADRVVKIIRRGVVSDGGLSFRLFEFTHGA
jgi:hypothetical protein